MLKKVLVVVLLLIAVSGTAGAYAYWDDLTRTQNESMTIGEGTTLELNVVAQAPTGKVLVPAGTVMKADDVDSITLSYTVQLDKTALDDLNLAVTAENVLIGGLATDSGLVNIDITLSSPTVNSSLVDVTVVVTLTEPASYDQYAAVINKDISFTLVFDATIAV